MSLAILVLGGGSILKWVLPFFENEFIFDKDVLFLSILR